MYNFDIFSLGPNHSYFAQGIYLIDKTENIPCAILEWSDTILELRNQVGILTLRRAILEWYRFLLCAEHIYDNRIRATSTRRSALTNGTYLLNVIIVL